MPRRVGPRPTRRRRESPQLHSSFRTLQGTRDARVTAEGAEAQHSCDAVQRAQQHSWDNSERRASQPHHRVRAADGIPLPYLPRRCVLACMLLSERVECATAVAAEEKRKAAAATGEQTAASTIRRAHRHKRSSASCSNSRCGGVSASGGCSEVGSARRAPVRSAVSE